ncbi:MAG: lipid-A-disaccharide synthase [Salinivirgaceae bacterium]|nr:lipid-A-disaccharide synthase [Salinivirgaceae bacterium]
MKYYLIAGEASGDLHGSNLMHEIKAQDPEAEFRFFGGDLMAAQGGTLVKHYSQMAFMGWIKVMMNLRVISRNMRLCCSDIINFKPDAVILIDFAGFNLRIAKFAKSKGLKTIFYISPKIWAWKQNRVYKIKKYIDKMLTILPFETEFYKQFDYEVEYVGNPLNDAIANFRNEPKADFRANNALSDAPIVALLAGSRKQEISMMLPPMIEATKNLTNYQIVVAGAPGIEPNFYNQYVPTGTKIVFGQTYQLLQNAHAALVTSGTATLETALFGVPQLVCYSTLLPNFLYRLGRKLIHVKWISLVNLIIGYEAVPELVQVNFTQKDIANGLQKILNDTPERKKMIADYAHLQQIMGKPGASQQAARAVIQFTHK